MVNATRGSRTISCATCGAPVTAWNADPDRKYCSRECFRNARSNARSFDSFYMPEPNSGCWIWMGAASGAVRSHNYGTWRGRKAHRVAYETAKGPIPFGLELDHLCRNTLCVNPDHLDPVTRRVNVERQPKVIAARSATLCANGHPWTPENTYRHPAQGSRICRSCTRAAAARYAIRKSIGGNF